MRSRLPWSLWKSFLIWSDHFIRNFTVLKLCQISRLVTWSEVRKIFELEMPMLSPWFIDCSGYQAYTLYHCYYTGLIFLKKCIIMIFSLVTIFDRDSEYKFWVNPSRSSRCGSVFRNYSETYDGLSEAL